LVYADLWYMLNMDNINSQKIFTAQELALFDGKNGMAAYAAVDGVGYDVSTVFQDGEHYAHIAGNDLSRQFKFQHGMEAITKYPVVGRMRSGVSG
jgi:membrane-associated progesterone receptor component